MLIGNGLIANSFKSYLEDKNIVIFASGVSNSNEIDIHNFEREEELLNDTLLKYSDLLIVYFSSCSLEDMELKNTPYHKHKLKMETLIQQHSNYLIFRIPQIVGNGGNKNSIVNFLVENIKNNKKFDIWKNAIRNLIDIEDIFLIVDFIIRNKIYKNDIINIASSKNIKIIELVQIIEKILNQKANYNLVDKGYSYSIDISKIESIIDDLNINFNNDYFIKLIKKYKV